MPHLLLSARRIREPQSYSSSSLLTPSPASIASSLIFFALARFLSSNLFNLVAELKTPFVPAPHAAHPGSFLYRFNAHPSQK